jgi:hypothetical protein
MSATTGPVKICALCGHDCSSRPRRRDQQGRYYCKSCYDDAAARRTATQTSSSTASLMGLSDVPDLSSLDQFVPAIPSGPVSCSACGQALIGGSVLCTNCGHRLDGARDVQTRVMHVPKSPVERGSSWHLVIGIVSIVMGSFGVLLYGIGAVINLMALSPGAIGAILPLLLAIWLLRGGIGLVKKQPSAIYALRRWAWVRGALAVVCTGTAGVLVMVAAGMMPDEVRTEMESQLPGFEMSMIGVLLLGIMVLQLVWPAVILIWTGQEGVRGQIDGWR